MATERRLIARPHEIAGFLAGTQTQFRRAVKLRDPSGTYSAHADDGWPESADEFGQWHRDRCPYGQPSDRLWVREAWHPSNHVPFGTRADYLADTPDARGEGFWKWKPSIHMPRWASRITLEITAVRVERLQAISESDARAEGVDWVAPDPYGEVWDDEREDPSQVGYSSAGASFARDNFRRLWGKINGKSHPWESNPWVWVCEVRKAVSGG
jgi:hypothetical protein